MDDPRMRALSSALMNQQQPQGQGFMQTPGMGGGMPGMMQGMGNNGQARNPMGGSPPVSAPGTMYADHGAMRDARKDFKDDYTGDGKWRNAWNDQNNGFTGQGQGGMATTPIPGNTGIVPPHMNPSPVPQTQVGPPPMMGHMGPGSGLVPPMPTMPPMPGRPDPRPMNPGTMPVRPSFPRI